MGAGLSALRDVDSDGDGRPDSIWVDLGLPIQTMNPDVN